VRERDPVRAVLEWKPQGNRPRGRPRKKMEFSSLTVVEEDLRNTGVDGRREIIYDRYRLQQKLSESL